MVTTYPISYPHIQSRPTDMFNISNAHPREVHNFDFCSYSFEKQTILKNTCNVWWMRQYKNGTVSILAVLSLNKLLILSFRLRCRRKCKIDLNKGWLMMLIAIEKDEGYMKLFLLLLEERATFV